MCLFMQRMSSFKLRYYQHSTVPLNKKAQSLDFASGISVLSWDVFTVCMHPFLVVRLPPATQRYSAGVNWWLCRCECACVLACLSRQSVCKGCHLPKDSCDKVQPHSHHRINSHRKWMDLQQQKALNYQLLRSIMYSRQIILLCFLNVK